MGTIYWSVMVKGEQCLKAKLLIYWMMYIILELWLEVLEVIFLEKAHP